MVFLCATGALALTQISDCAGLQNMNQNLAEDYELSGNINCDVAPFNTGEGFHPVGNFSDEFTGTFDGKGYTISGLFIDRSSADYVGLFVHSF